MQDEWRSVVASVYKNKGDIQICTIMGLNLYGSHYETMGDK